MKKIRIYKDKTTKNIVGYSLYHDERAFQKDKNTRPNTIVVEKDISDDAAKKLDSLEFDLKLGADDRIMTAKKQAVVDHEAKQTKREALKTKFNNGTATQADIIEAIKILL